MTNANTMTRRALAGAIALTSAALLAPAATAASDTSAVLDTYADIAQAKLEDSLTAARSLRTSVDALLAAPSDATLTAAREAWLAARVPYQQTEVYRFGNVFQDEWEGKVNAWPLDEGLIDYVDGSYGADSEENRFYTANVIANPTLSFGGTTVDAGTITPAVLQQLHEVDEVEANVATGYHAIEFLLWGQDLNGTGAGAGDRPATDFAEALCTGGNCERRRAYLDAATDLLLADLGDALTAWSPGGEARTALDGDAGIAAIVTGMGSLSYGELAGERMQLGLLLNDPEEEHDCFSDNTHNSHYYDVVGIRNVYIGQYDSLAGNSVDGASLSDLVKATDPALDREMRDKLDAAIAAFAELKQLADSGEMAYDQMIGPGNSVGNAKVQAAIDALVTQTRSIEKVALALDLGALEVEGSDSLDNPSAVFE